MADSLDMHVLQSLLLEDTAAQIAVLTAEMRRLDDRVTRIANDIKALRDAARGAARDPAYAPREWLWAPSD